MATWRVYEAMMARAFMHRLYAILAITFLLGLSIGAASIYFTMR